MPIHMCIYTVSPQVTKVDERISCVIYEHDYSEKSQCRGQ